MIIIDDVSMVSNKMLLHIHQRLKEIFATPDHMLFAGKSIIAVGDLFQLPPIMASPIFANYQKELLNLCHPWKEFTMIELPEIMKPKDEIIFIELLNRIRIGQCSDEDVQLLWSREISQDSADYPSDALHVWCENGPVDTHNAFKLTQLNTPEVVSVAQDKFPPNIKQRDIDRVLSQSRSKTGGLEAQLHLKQGARVMLTTNLAIADCLTNGQLGAVTGFKFQQNNPNSLVVYVKFDDRKAGISTIRQSGDSTAHATNAVPITTTLSTIGICSRKHSSPQIERPKFSLCLAWACTIHKVQGLTLDKLIISFELH